MDRISNLPEDLILQIVSLLSAKEAARLQIVSKLWRNLITIIPILVYDQSIHIHNINGSFKDFTNGLCARPPSHFVNRFFLRLNDDVVDASQYQLVNDCLCNVVKRGVLDIGLDINVTEDYSLPSEVFSCRTVVRMRLGTGFAIRIIPRNGLLPELKFLAVDFVRFDGVDGCAFQRLVSVCPVLEELVIDGLSTDQWNWSSVVSSQVLKRLTLHRFGNEGPIVTEAISFDTPNLVYFDYDDCLRDEYPVVNFNSLVEAKLNLPFQDEDYDLTNLIKGLKNVQIMSLEAPGTMSLFVDFVEATPVFENLVHLAVTSENFSCWNSLEILLEKSPNLKTLTIQGPLHYVRDSGFICECLKEYSFLNSWHIETLTITEFTGDIGEMVHLKYVLENLPCVELVEVHLQARYDEEKQEIEDLLMLLRASTKCKVQVKFS